VASNQSRFGPWESVQIDLVGPISPPSREGYQYICTYICTFLRHPLIGGIPDKRKGTVIKMIVVLVLRSRRIPSIVSWDNGPEFLNALVHEVVTLLGVDSRFSAPFVAREHGIVEGGNKKLQQSVRRMLLDAVEAAGS